MRLLDRATRTTTHVDYPATTGDLIDAHGESTLDLPNGSETVGEVLGRLAAETFQTEAEARTAVYSAISAKGIGREGYSDRDPFQPGEASPDQMSL